jgi:UDP-2,4-diacetamido-2,4,6-trideoxy-beta-L-altropyranose hydrolase
MQVIKIVLDCIQLWIPFKDTIMTKAMLSSPSVLIRCDGSKDIGFGHVFRCLALAGELIKSHNCRVVFAMRESEVGIKLVKKYYDVIPSDSSSGDFNYEQWLVQCIKASTSDILILDVRDGLNEQNMKTLRSLGVKIVTIDDPEEKRIQSDMAFYPPIPQIQEYSWAGFKGDLFVGWDYVVLRKEYFERKNRQQYKIKNILVAMGGSDNLNLTQMVVSILAPLEHDYSLNILLGPGYQYVSELKNTLDQAHIKNEIFVNPNNVAEIMSKSFFAIASFGVTAYELAALGIPSILVSISADHLKSASIFSEEGVSINIGEYSTFDKNQLLMEVNRLLGNPKLIEEMSGSALKLFKSNNLQLISEAIMTLMN